MKESSAAVASPFLRWFCFTLYLYDSGLFWASFVVLFAAFAAILCNTNMEKTKKKDMG